MTGARPGRKKTGKHRGGTFIDLFAGCGGLSLGLVRSGWRGILAVERDKHAFETLEHNLLDGHWKNRYGWVDWFPREPCTIGRFLRKYREHVEDLRGKVDLIAGGPPCQGFSFAGKRRRGDARNHLFKNYLEVVRLVKPPFLLLENVKGINTAFGKTRRERGTEKRGRPARPFSQRIKEALEDEGYMVEPRLFKAVDYGVAQVRPRYIMLGARKRIVAKEKFEETLSRSNLEMNRRAFLRCKGLRVRRPLTVWEAISDLEMQKNGTVPSEDSKGFQQVDYREPVTRYQKLLHGSRDYAPDSLRLANHREETVSRFKYILENCRKGVSLSDEDREHLGIRKQCFTPLAGSMPAHTLTTLPDDYLHYSEPRILTVREFARLQSFPDRFEFRGKYTTGGRHRTKECPRYTQVGNAVPPMLAEFLGRLLAGIRSEAPKVLHRGTRRERARKAPGVRSLEGSRANGPPTSRKS